MAVPPPIPDPAHIEVRLMVLAEMLERAVAEVRRISGELKTGTTPVDLGSHDDKP